MLILSFYLTSEELTTKSTNLTTLPYESNSYNPTYCPKVTIKSSPEVYGVVPVGLDPTAGVVNGTPRTTVANVSVPVAVAIILVVPVAVPFASVAVNAGAAHAVTDTVNVLVTVALPASDVVTTIVRGVAAAIV